MRRLVQRRSKRSDAREVKKLRFVVPILFVTVYLIASFLFLGTFGGAGHGAGIGAFMNMSLPSILLAITIDGLYPHHDLTVWLGLLGGTAQYALVGYLLVRLLNKRSAS
jgi:hypothetical protein